MYVHYYDDAGQITANFSKFRNTISKERNNTRESTVKPDPHLSHQDKALEYEKRMADYRYATAECVGLYIYPFHISHDDV